MQKGEDKQIKCIVSTALGLAMFLPIQPTCIDAPLYTHLFAPLGHGNLIHLLANLYVLWIMRINAKQLCTAYIMGVIAMALSINPCIGFSAVLYALIGLNVPRIRISKAEWGIFIAANAITILIPNIATLAHFIAFMLGLCYTKLSDLINEYEAAIRGK